MAGVFFQPKQLSALSNRDLLGYLDECELDLIRIQNDLARLEGRLEELNKNFHSEGLFVAFGVVTAVAGIAATAIVTFGGALVLVGGAVSLIGADRYGVRLVDRNLVSDQVKSRRESIAFLTSELKRVQEEMDRRNSP